MILSCPSCQARYLVNPVQLGDAGRRVKCARCHHVWYAARPADSPVPPVVPEVAAGPTLAASRPAGPVAEPPPGKAAAYEPFPPVSGQLPSTVVLRRSRIPAAFWALLVLLVGAVVAVGVVARGDMVRLYPPAIVLYEAVGLPVDRSVLAGHPWLQPALQITRLETELDEAGDLLVSGTLVNSADGSRRLSPLAISLNDADGAALASHQFDLGQTMLEAGQSLAFEIVIEDWPEGAREATVGLAE